MLNFIRTWLKRKKIVDDGDYSPDWYKNYAPSLDKINALPLRAKIRLYRSLMQKYPLTAKFVFWPLFALRILFWYLKFIYFVLIGFIISLFERRKP
jgi:hypothetical protein